LPVNDRCQDQTAIQARSPERLKMAENCHSRSGFSNTVNRFHLGP
jgi:hypothetical protein